MAEITGWFTMNGVHIPIMNGESRTDAAKRFLDKKVGKYTKNASFYQKGDVVGITQYRIQKAQRDFEKSDEGYFKAKDKLNKEIKSATESDKYTKKLNDKFDVGHSYFNGKGQFQSQYNKLLNSDRNGTLPKSASKDMKELKSFSYRYGRMHNDGDVPRKEAIECFGSAKGIPTRMSNLMRSDYNYLCNYMEVKADKLIRKVIKSSK